MRTRERDLPRNVQAELRRLRKDLQECQEHCGLDTLELLRKMKTADEACGWYDWAAQPLPPGFQPHRHMISFWGGGA